MTRKKLGARVDTAAVATEAAGVRAPAAAPQVAAIPDDDNTRDPALAALDRAAGTWWGAPPMALPAMAPADQPAYLDHRRALWRLRGAQARAEWIAAQRPARSRAWWGRALRGGALAAGGVALFLLARGKAVNGRTAGGVGTAGMLLALAFPCWLPALDGAGPVPDAPPADVLAMLAGRATAEPLEWGDWPRYVDAFSDGWRAGGGAMAVVRDVRGLLGK